MRHPPITLDREKSDAIQRGKILAWQMIALSCESHPENKLYQAQIVQYLQDSIAKRPIGTPANKKDGKKFADNIRNEARQWFNPHNEDFLVTCDMTNWTPEITLAMFSNVQQSGTVPRILKTFTSGDLIKKVKRSVKRSNTSNYPSILKEFGVECR